MSDEEIVVFDLFVHNECLYLEKDIVACLNLNEQKARTILSKLLREQFIVEIRKHKNEEDRNSAFQTFYCLNNYIVYVIDFRIKQMEIEIQNKKTERDIYICKYCNVTYSQMDAPMLPLDPYDAHFLCFCNKKIELIATEENSDENIYNRYTKYLNIIKEYTDKLKNYYIPMYTEKFDKYSLPSAGSAVGEENGSEVSLANNSSELTLTNNSSLLSQGIDKKIKDHVEKKRKEEYVDNCSSVIRSNKKIKIKIKKRGKGINSEPLEESGKTNRKMKDGENLHTQNDTVEEKMMNDSILNNDMLDNDMSNNDLLNDDMLNDGILNNVAINSVKNDINLNSTENGINEKMEKKNRNDFSNDRTNDKTNKSGYKKGKSKDPMFFIKKHNQHYTLKDAQKLQQDMTQDEFERFVELQDVYLDDF